MFIVTSQKLPYYIADNVLAAVIVLGAGVRW